jgi:2-succinyl-5-enolpyruvyl-6-hydroxy-3-cyclohexene-1-carboxylate synthase
VSDPQSQWAELLLASLVAAGVRAAVISPGSRSTPLVWAASRTSGLVCHSIIDERSAGFYALGQARVTGLPSLLICTSGSALSNYFPAVIEARASGIPLLVLSADRPFEAQHCGAHQTIDQTRLFGAYAPYHELGTPVADREALLALRRTAWHAVQSSLDAPRGAVHLNFRARKPLEPGLEPASIALPELGPRPPLARAERTGMSEVDVDRLLALLEGSSCPLLICGASAEQDAPSAALVRRFADLSGSIVCIEAVSQQRLRLGGDAGNGLVCDSYDWLLGSPALSRAFAPDFALQLGGTPVSSALERLLSSRAAPIAVAICAETGWPDPLSQSAEILRARPTELLEAACARLEQRERQARPRLGLWREAQALARAAIERHTESVFGEAAAVVQLCGALPRGSLLAVGNSLPPRLLDRYVAATAADVQVCCQRGASGIEGAIAGAFGAATQCDAAVTLLVGDISFLHDIGSLWAAVPARTHAEPRVQPIVIVVLNNAGGRIFEQLPIAARPDAALELWTTPHQLRLRAAAELYGLAYAEVSERRQLGAALARAYAGPGVTLIEVLVEPDNAIRSQSALSAALEPRLLELCARQVG